jgi:putative ABC transport system substrate-binding protein
MSRRRKLILALGASALTPLASIAQQPSKIARIGFLGPTTAAGMATRLAGFRVGLRELGYAEGKNIFIDYRWAESDYDRLPALAAELVQIGVDVIVTGTTAGMRAAKQASATIPIVVASVGADPVASGLVASLARPGGNITGSTNMSEEISGKRLELLKETFPRARQAAFLLHPENPTSTNHAMDRAAKSLNVTVRTFKVRSFEEVASAFFAIAKSNVNAVVIHQDPFLIANVGAVANLVAKSRLASSGFIEFADAGGLIGYGVNVPALYRRAAYFVDRILKGARAGDLPFERATQFELIINLKTAKSLGITIPRSIMVRADRVIE